MSEGHDRDHPSSASPIRVLSRSSRQLGDDEPRSYDTFDPLALHPSPLQTSRHQAPILNSGGRRSQGGGSPPRRAPPPPPSFSLEEFTPNRKSQRSSHEAESTISWLQLSSGIDSLGHVRNLENIVTYLKNYYAQETGEDKCGLETLHPDDIVALAKCFCTDVQRLVRERRQKMGMSVVSLAVGESPLSGVISNTTSSESSISNSGDNLTQKSSLEEGGVKKNTPNVQPRHRRGTVSSGGSVSVMDKHTEAEKSHEPPQNQKHLTSFQPPPLQEGQSQDHRPPGTQIVEAIVPVYGTPLKRAGSQASASSQPLPQRRVSIITSHTGVSPGASHLHEDTSLSSVPTWRGMGVSPADARAKAPVMPSVNPQVYVAAHASSSAPLGVPLSRPGLASVGRPPPPPAREGEPNSGRSAKSPEAEARDDAGTAAHLPKKQRAFHGEGLRGSLNILMKVLRQGTYLVKYFSSFRTPHIRFFCVQDCMTKYNGREVRMPHLVWRPKAKDHWSVEHFREDGSKSNALNLIHLHTARLGVDLAPELFKRRGGYVIDHCGRPLPADMCLVLIFHSRTLGLSFLTKADRQLWMDAFTAIIDRNRSLHH
ncbi:unnamed protein product [Phytomonas sp. EM1]|nr:unnamed protein product [Phytomonas sp. EM1]|eukprot:CCW65511.1 unnamed protein product [Phytomonas sp. isolate EM1]